MSKSADTPKDGTTVKQEWKILPDEEAIAHYFLPLLGFFLNEVNKWNQQEASLLFSARSIDITVMQARWLAVVDALTGQWPCPPPFLTVAILSCVLLIQTTGLHQTSLICSFYGICWRTSHFFLTLSFTSRGLAGPEVKCWLDSSQKCLNKKEWFWGLEHWQIPLFSSYQGLWVTFFSPYFLTLQKYHRSEQDMFSKTSVILKVMPCSWQCLKNKAVWHYHHIFPLTVLTDL